MSKQHTLIALYDAHPEHAHFENPIIINRSRILGQALGNAKLGIISRVSSPSILSAMSALSEAGVHSVALSPAGSLREHVQAFRLPMVSVPLLFTGRGAVGADLMAISSAHAMIVVGSYPDVLESILSYTKHHEVPIGILTDEDSENIHYRLNGGNSKKIPHLFVSHDPEILVRQISEELRRRSLSEKYS